jgi:hypothetical protein
MPVIVVENAVMASSAPNHSGFEFDTLGENRRVPADLDGYRLVVEGEAALPIRTWVAGVA